MWRENWYFLILLALLGGAALYFGYRLRNRRDIERTRKLEEQVAERTSEIEQRRQIAEGLREILVILNSDRSLEESLHHIVSQAARLTEAEDAIIFRRQEDNKLDIVATNPGGQIRYEAGSALLATTQPWLAGDILEKKPLIVSDLSIYWPVYPAIQLTDGSPHQALLGVPLFVGEKNYGGLIMFYTQRRSFSDDDLDLGHAFADQAALAIANERLRERAEQTAVASERNRLARDLHDAVTQTLFSASLIAESIPTIWERNANEGRQLLEELKKLTRGALAEMRTLLLELRPSALIESNLPDLLEQLSEVVTGRTGVLVEATLDLAEELPTEVHISLYRIAQESLNNVMKHARASLVVLQLGRPLDNDVVLLSIKDDGRGFDVREVSGDHLGLNIIRERAQLIGASLTIDSLPGAGTEVKVVWTEGKRGGL